MHAFTLLARSIQAEAARLGLVAPGLATPPRSDTDRSLRRHPNAVVIRVRIAGRDPHAVAADVIDGVIAAQPVDLGDTEAMIRGALWEAAGLAVSGCAA